MFNHVLFLVPVLTAPVAISRLSLSSNEVAINAVSIFSNCSKEFHDAEVIRATTKKRP